MGEEETKPNTTNNNNIPIVENISKDNDDPHERTGVEDKLIQTTGVDIHSIDDESICSTEENHNESYKSINDCDYPDDVPIPDDFLDGKPDDVDNKPIQNTRA